MLTHHNAIDLGQISKQIVFIESVLGESNHRSNGWIKALLVEYACQDG